jgi:hypothetical protein
VSEYDVNDPVPGTREPVAGTREDDTDTGAAVVAVKAKPQFYKVVATHPNLHKRVMFRSISETRARQWLANHYPRGSEAHLIAPDGTTEHYERERAGEHGEDASLWAPFDPESWIPVDQNPPPGDSEWADKEG